ncbi:hypothetical protein ABR157_004547 [Enterobacter soli]|nr:hypothetical protein [Enterobacter asburiae]
MNKKGGHPSEHYHLPPVGMVEDWITAKATHSNVFIVAVVPPPAGLARTGDATPQETYSFQKLK